MGEKGRCEDEGKEERGRKVRVRCADEEREGRKGDKGGRIYTVSKAGRRERR